jgi:hypothetical protein
MIPGERAAHSLLASSGSRDLIWLQIWLETRKKTATTADPNLRRKRRRRRRRSL